MNDYRYEAYGLTISSEIELPELKKGQKTPDIFIRLGDTKKVLDNVDKSGIRFQANQQEFVLNLEQIASFYVKDGNEIIIKADPDAELRDIRIFLLGSVFGALLHQRGNFVLHASTVLTPKGALAISGISGAGKSTLAAALQKEGYKIISDDVTLVNCREKQPPFVLPGLRRVKLWQDAADKLAVEYTDETAIRKDINKFNINVELHDLSTELKHLIVLNTHNDDTVQYDEIKGFAKIDALIKNTYRFIFLSDEQKKNHLSQCGAISSHVKMHRMMRPKKGFTLKEQVEIVKGLLNEDG
jgi:predicted ATPase